MHLFYFNFVFILITNDIYIIFIFFIFFLIFVLFFLIIFLFFFIIFPHFGNILFFVFYLFFTFFIFFFILIFLIQILPIFNKDFIFIHSLILSFFRQGLIERFNLGFHLLFLNFNRRLRPFYIHLLCMSRVKGVYYLSWRVLWISSFEQILNLLHFAY